MAINTAETAPVYRARAAERLHEVARTEFRIDTDDVLVNAHADGTVTAQLATNIARADGPTVRTLSLP